jgi:hypothetical protein
MSDARFNLTFLRNRKGISSTAEEGKHQDSSSHDISRRAFLQLSGIGVAATAIPSYLRGEGFSIARQGRTVYVLTGQHVRWTIAAAHFGENASVRLDRTGDLVELELSNATFPGTSFPADLKAIFAKRAGVWLLQIRMQCGLDFETDLLPWLLGKSTGRGTLQAGLFKPIDGMTIRQSSKAAASFSPAWKVTLSGPGEVGLKNLPHALPYSSWNISAQPVSQLAAGTLTERTHFDFARKYHSWKVSLDRQAAEGWSLKHESDLFDELCVEGLRRDGELVQTALLRGLEHSPGDLYLHPGGGLLSDTREPFRMKLDHPRMAFSMEGEEVQSALIADVSTEPVWAHTPEMSLMLTGGGEHPHFELIDSLQTGGTSRPAVPSIAPKALCADISCGADSNLKMTFNGQHPVHFNWATGIQSIEHFLGRLHLTPWENKLAFDLTCDHEFRLLRPQDQFQLRFRFENMRLETCIDASVRPRKDIPPSGTPYSPPPSGKQVHCRPIPGRTPRVTVIFPPQHVVEEAFFESLVHRPPPAAPSPLGPVELHDGITPVALDPDSNNTTGDPQSVPVKCRLSGPSQLVFELPASVKSIPFNFEGLLSWKEWLPIIAATAKTDAAPKKTNTGTTPVPPIVDPTDPDTPGYATAIEMPYRLYLSPTERGGWAHSVEPVDYGTQNTELWHTRLGIRSDEGVVDEEDAADRIGRAIWSPDFEGTLTNPLPPHDSPPDHFFPFRSSMDGRDRAEIVHLTSNYGIEDFKPSPLQFDRLMLTPMGGYLLSLGAWNPPKLHDPASSPNDFLTVEQWRHQLQLARDQYVRVVYKGYLLPFGHRASLVKITERVFRKVTQPGSAVKVYTALLRQYMYLTMQHPRRDYPLMGQSFSGRGFPFRRVDVLTPSTPPIDDPQDQTLFWPTVGGQLFPLNFKFWDMDNHVSLASANVLFVGAGVAQVTASAGNAIHTYETGYNSDPDTRVSQFNGQEIAFADSTKPGDTTYNVASILWDANLSTTDANTLYKNDLPCFTPEVASFLISSSTINRVSGKNPTDPSSQTRVVFYQNYLEAGFDPKVNHGEVILQVSDKALNLSFGGSNGNVDKSGGLVSPDSLVVGFSRSAGPVGGRPSDVGPNPGTRTTTSALDIHASGSFDPATFFGGLTSAKILGAVKLSDVIGAFAQGMGSDIGKIPQMIQNTLGSIDDGAFDIETTVINSAFEPIQSLVDSVQALVPIMAGPAADVRSAWQSVQQAHATNKTSPSPEGAVNEARLHAQLIGNLAKYADALGKIVQNPLAIAEQEALELLSDLLGTQKIIDFQNALGGAYDALIDNLISTAEARITQAQAVLGAFEADAKRMFVDPFIDGLDMVKQVVVSDLVPDLMICLDALPVAEDLVTRVKTLSGSTTATPAQKILQVIAGLGPILQDLLQLEEKLGFVGLATATQAVVATVSGLEDTVTQQWNQLIVGINQSLLTPALSALSDACLTLAAVPAFQDAAQTLQNLRQLQRAIQKLTTATAAFATSIGDASKKNVTWRCSMLQRQLIRQALESILALRRVAETAQASGVANLQQPAGILAAACDATAAVLNIAPNLILHGKAALLAFKNANLAATAAVQSKLDQLDTQMTSLESQIAPPAGPPPPPSTLLSLSIQYINAWLQYQGPLAAVYGWSLYKDAQDADKNLLTGLNQLSNLASYAQWAAGRASDLRAGCVTLQAAAHSLRQSIDNAITSPSTPGAALASAAALQALADAMDNGFALFGATDGPVSFALRDAAAAISSAAQFVTELKQEFTDLQSDVAQIEKIVAMLPDLLKKIPQAAKVELSLDWHPNIRSFEPVFRLEDGADLVVTASTVISLGASGPPTYDISAKLTNFSINLIGNLSFVIVSFNSLEFSSSNGSKPNCKLDIDTVTFGQQMAFVEKLASLLDPGDGPFIEFADGMLNAGYRFQVPTIIVGAFTMMQLRLEVSIGLPFNGDPVRCYFGISDSDNPLLLSVGIYGGTAYLLLRLGLDGVERLEGSLDFGVVAVVSMGPLSGYGEVVAGIHFAIGGGSSEVCGYVHAHGHCDIFGIVSLDVKVNVDICCIAEGGHTSVQGDADFSVDIEMLFLSVTYKFNAKYQFAGSQQSASLDTQSDVELASLEMPAMPFSTAAAPQAPVIPSRKRSHGPIDNNRIDSARWKEYFKSFDRFPDEVLQ